jgi:hypothetical protein
MAIEYSKAGAPLDADTRSAIGVILEYIDQMYLELKSYHIQDKADAKCPVALKCAETYLNSSGIEGMLKKVEIARQEHLRCRTGLQSKCNGYDWTGHEASWQNPPPSTAAFKLLQMAETTASMSHATKHCNSAYCVDMVENGEDHCLAYDNFRKALDPTTPVCEERDFGSNEGQAFQDSFIEADEGSDDLQTMEDCLETTKLWFDPLWEHYMKCQCRKCNCVALPKKCKDDQTTFEQEYCLAETKRRSECSELAECWKEETAKCKPGGEVCDTIANNVKGRKVDNETGERIRCLLNVLNGTDDVRVEGLLECTHNKTYSTDYWDITCPDGLTCTPHDICDVIPLPCESGFLESEYKNQGEPLFGAPFDVNNKQFEDQVGECIVCTQMEDQVVYECPEAGSVSG